jgi:uncharacterized protein (DUF3820 family)
MKTVQPGDLECDLAANKVVPFGRFKGNTLEEIYDQDGGREYLVWLYSQSWLFEDLAEAIDTFLCDPSR